MTPTILLRSSWQTVNIGDVAHSPGALQALRRWAPHAEVILWPLQLEERERDMFASAFPEVAIVEGDLYDDGTASTEALTSALDRADVLVHGSAPGLVRGDDLEVWSRTTGKPYGFFGVTIDPLGPRFTGTLDELEHMIRNIGTPALEAHHVQLLDGASFIYCRDSLTVGLLRSLDLRCPTISFGPDATLAFDVVDDDSAHRIKAAYDLRDGAYMCAVPRQRWTPYYRIRGEPRTVEDSQREANNALWTEHDLGVLTAAVVAYVRRTGRDVLVGAEMVYAVALGQQYFTDRLPHDVRQHVHVLPWFWSVEEASAVYRDAEVVVSIECHSPLMAISQGTPSIYVRQPSDTTKGRMYADIGAAEQMVEIDHGSPPLLRALGRILDDPAAARERVVAIRRDAHHHLQAMVETVLTVACTRPAAPAAR